MDDEPVKKKKRLSSERNEDEKVKKISCENEDGFAGKVTDVEDSCTKTAAKKSSFDVHSLRKRLKGDTSLQAVKLLISACEVPESDVITEYITAGGGPLELLQVISNPDMKKNPICAGPVFSAVQLVVVKILSDFPLLHKSAEEACYYLIREFMPTIHLMLIPAASVNHRIIALKLLTTVVSVSTQLARDVLNSVNLEFSHVEHLAAQVSPHDRKSVRVTFIHFILSFVIEGNSYIIRQLLQNKGLLRLVTQDLIFDNSVTVTFLLTALRDNVVSSLMIPKSLKIHCFNTAVLMSLLEIYNWLGPKHWVSRKSLTEDRFAILFKGDEEERNGVRECVHSLLVLLCTSHKLGVSFFDRNIGTGPCQNVILRSLFKAIEKQWEDNLVKELTRLILLQNPDLLTSAFVAFKKQFEPRPTKHWLSTFDFVSQVIEGLDPKLCLPNHLGNQQIVKLIKNLCLPSSVLNAICCEESLISKNCVLRSTIVKCLLICIKKLHNFISFTELPSKLIEPVLVRHLNQVGPKIDWIISAWKMGTSTVEDSLSLEVLSDVDYNISFVELMLLLYKISPELLESADEWSDDLIASSLQQCSRMGDQDNKKISVLKLETLKMISVLKTLGPAENAFSVCVAMLIQLMKTDLKEEAKNTFENLLLSTGLLEGVEDEIEVWLYCLVKGDSDLSIVEFFQEIMKEASINTAHHFKTISDACNGTSTFLGSSSSSIDDIISMLEDDDDDDFMNKGTQKCNIVRNQQSLSPLVPAMLQVVNNKKIFQKQIQNEEIIIAKQNFVTSVLVHSLHRQTYPERLLKILQEYKAGVATAAICYISSWTEPGSTPHPLTFVPFEPSSLESKLSKFFLQEGKVNKLMKDILGLLNNFSENNSKLLLHLCIFYLTQLFQRNDLTSEIVQNSSKFISLLLNSMNHSSKSFHSMLQGVLVHPVVVNMFQPMKKDLHNDLTEIVFLFIKAATLYINDKNALSDTLYTCKKKLLNGIIKALKKQKELKLTKLTLILQEVSLSEEDIQKIIFHLISLPSHIQESGWCEVEALLLNQAADNSILLVEDTFESLSLQMTESDGGPDCLQLAFMNYIQRFPHYIKYIKNDLFVVLLKKDSDGTNLELAKLLLSSNKRLVSIFKDNITEKSSLLFPLLSTVDCNSFDQAFMSTLVLKQIPYVQEGIFNQALWFTQHSLLIASLLEKYLEKKRKKKLLSTLRSQWDDLPCHLSVLNILKSITTDNSEVIELVSNLFGWLVQVLDDSSQDEFLWLYESVTEILNSKKKDVNWQQLLDHEFFNNVIRLSLKVGLHQDKSCSLNLLKMLVGLCNAVFSDKNLTNVSEVFDLLISHSDFIPVMIDNSDITCQVVELLLVLLKNNPKLIQSSHVPIYLSAYGATLSKTDQKILELLQLYESNGSSVWEWRPCLWGPSAANFYSVHSKSAQPLWRQPRMSQVLDLLDRDIVDMTISKFPLKRTLQADTHFVIDEGEKIYDPAFILPLLTHLLATGADVQHRSMINSGALAVTLASLCSLCSDLRSVAYLVLTRFHSHLSSGENDQQLWLNFINTIRGGVLELGEECPQIATIITTFLAQASLVLSFPQHPLFTVLHNFVLAKSALNLTSIPAFLELLQSKDVQHRDHQEWILKVLRDGTRQKTDMKLLFQSLAFKILMTLYSFVHTTKDLKILIIETLLSCVSIQDAGFVLVSNYGLISWISHCLMNKENEEMSSLIRFFEKLSNFKSCSLHLKLIIISVASCVTSVSDSEIVLKILSNNKIISHLNKNDVEVIISMTANQIGSSNVQKAKDMMKFGCKYVTDVSDSNVTVSVLNKLVYDWLNKK